MNKTYRVVWNGVTRAVAVASELATTPHACHQRLAGPMVVAQRRLPWALACALAGVLAYIPVSQATPPATESADSILSPHLATDAQIEAVLAHQQRQNAPFVAASVRKDAPAGDSGAANVVVRPESTPVTALPPAARFARTALPAVVAEPRLAPLHFRVAPPTFRPLIPTRSPLAPVDARIATVDTAAPAIPVPRPGAVARTPSVADIAGSGLRSSRTQTPTALVPDGQNDQDALVASADEPVSGGALVGNPMSGVPWQFTQPTTSMPAAAPVPPAVPAPPAGPPPGLMVGTGGLTGNVGGALNPTLFSLLGANSNPNTSFLTSGRMQLAADNVTQSYAVTNVNLGLLGLSNLLTLNPVLNGANATLTGTDQNLTLLGGVTSGNYIANINSGTLGAGTTQQTGPGGILGVLLPNGAPAWASGCGDLLGLGVVTSQCWSVNAAQNNQVLIGDGASANGSEEVVIGTGASHTLPVAQADAVFPGDGTGGQAGTEGVPDADYQARLGHSVVIGDSASGSMNAQTLLGADATSDQPNSVALGFDSFADRGPVASYTAFGLTGTQSSDGEVSVGNDGAVNPLDVNHPTPTVITRQITNVAPGSAATDAVNVEQLQGAVSGAVAGADKLSVKYDADADGNPTNTVTLVGDGTGAVRVTNLTAGTLSTSSTDAVNGSQLFGADTTLAQYFGGQTAFNGTTWTAPNFTISNIDAGGNVTSGSYGNVTDAFAALDTSLDNVNSRITTNNADLKYFQANSIGAAAVAGGTESVAVGGGAEASAASSVAIGSSATVSAANSVALGNGSVASIGALTNYQAFGLTALQTSVGEVNVGNRQITGVAAGSAATDAVNVEQLQGAVAGAVTSADKLAVKYDADPSGNATNTVTLVGDGTGAQVTVANVAAGTLSASSTDAVNGSQLFGANTTIAQYFGGATAFNGTAWVPPDFSITNIAANGAVTVGNYNNVTSAFAALDASLTNINNRIGSGGGGGGSDFAVNDSNGLGTPTASGANSAAGGAGTVASGADSTAIGNGAQANGTNSVALGAGSVANRNNVVSVGSAGNDRQITNVAAGTAATDAVNVQQLDASEAGTVRYDSTNNTVNYNSITLGNPAGGGGPTVIHNVAPGVDPTDAVNVAQLNGVQNWAKQYTDQQVNGLHGQIYNLGNRAYAGIASAMAMAGLPQAYLPGKSMASVAASSFHGESSLAIGVSMISQNGRWVYKLSGTDDSRGDAGVTVGAGIQW